MIKSQPNIRLTKIFSFEMAHALLGYDGACRNIHGHSYVLHVTVIGVPKYDSDHPKDGMVADFKDLKKWVKRRVVEVYDHALMLNEKTSAAAINGLKGVYEKVILKPFQPTCENMLVDILSKLEGELPEGIKLFSLKLFETNTSYAEWFLEDQ